MNQFIIGLTGPAGVGKNTVADALGWPQAAFADRLKEIAAPIFTALGKDVKKRSDKESLRPVLVALGAAVRKDDPSYWVKNLKLPNSNVVVITDLRYLNEAMYVWASGGMVIELHREGFLPDNEEEERSFKELHAYAKEYNINIPQVHNKTPEDAANDIGTLVIDKWQLMHDVINRQAYVTELSEK